MKSSPAPSKPVLDPRPDDALIGIVNSIETFGTVDGPGLRTVVFMQDCGMSCIFCHNPECAADNPGIKPSYYTVQDLAAELLKYEKYWGKSGGVTFSGGEPLIQYQFLAETSKILKKAGVNIAIDTCLYVPRKAIDLMQPFVDHWLCSIKHIDNATHEKLTGRRSGLVFKNLIHLDKLLSQNEGRETSKIIRIRLLVIPGYTNSAEYLEEFAKFIKQYNSVELVEILGYKSHAKVKWESIYGEGSYQLDGVEEASPADLELAREILGRNGFKTMV